MAEQTQADLWNGEAGARWTRYQDALDRMFLPFDRAGLRRAAATPGESVLEVGCGCGGTTLELAHAVGPQGSVLGVDISRPMLQRARERCAGWPNVTLRQGDAGSYAFPDPVTLIYSRFGVMFFDDPGQAFANLHATLGLGGRLCFVCWRAPELNPWLDAAASAAAPWVQLPPAPPPLAPGPFSLASEERIHTLLAGAGFEDVQLQAHDEAMQLSDHGLDPAVDLLLEAVGPLARILANADAERRRAVHDAVREELRPHLKGEVVALPASVWIVHAR